MAEPQNGTNPALGSEWGGLNPALIATFFAVERMNSEDAKTVLWRRDTKEPEVFAPLTDGNMETTLNWQSPFENVSPDQKFSSLSAMLQSGGLASILAQIQQRFPDIAALDNTAKQLKTLEGKSNISKLNSTQIFSGMPPIKINVTAHFRAYQDPDREVRRPLDQLMKWALPKKLAQNGPAAAALGGNLEAFQSEVPQIIGMKYADMLFMPLVIESIPYPLTGPRDRYGVLTQASIALQLATLTALDKEDWISARVMR